ncbi:MAG: IS3 family transposase [Alicyclobacillus herbarius]|nr:IS3 family transposase [Alicyclobacillus herbarius]
MYPKSLAVIGFYVHSAVPNVNSRRLYGSPKITQVLQKERVRVSQKTVARIMQERGLKSRTVITKRPPTCSITSRYMRIC